MHAACPWLGECKKYTLAGQGSGLAGRRGAAMIENMPRWLDGFTVPDPAWADEDGLVALGGDLGPERLLLAYRAGVFPWSSRPVLTWWSPDPRVIFDIPSYRPHRSVRQTMARAPWRYAIDEDFGAVIRACAEGTAQRPSTWITADFIAAYTELHRRGHAHSVEVYEGDELVGGLYGVTLGAFFGGESMFHRRSDASKAALAHLIERLRIGGFLLADAQAPNAHLARLGAIPIARDEYLRRLRAAIAEPPRRL